jgi:hypothetical protein
MIINNHGSAQFFYNIRSAGLFMSFFTNCLFLKKEATYVRFEMMIRHAFSSQLVQKLIEVDVYCAFGKLCRN